MKKFTEEELGKLKLGLIEARDEPEIMAYALQTASEIHARDKPGLLCTDLEYWYKRVWETFVILYARCREQHICTQLATFGNGAVSSYIHHRAAINTGRKGGKPKRKSGKIEWLETDIRDKLQRNPSLTAKGYLNDLRKRPGIVHDNGGESLYFTDEFAESICLDAEKDVNITITLNTVKKILTRLRKQ